MYLSRVVLNEFQILANSVKGAESYTKLVLKKYYSKLVYEKLEIFGKYQYFYIT